MDKKTRSTNSLLARTLLLIFEILAGSYMLIMAGVLITITCGIILILIPLSWLFPGVLQNFRLVRRNIAIR